MSHVFNGEKDGDYVVITGNFDVTYRDVKAGCEGLLKQIMDKM